jgi:hypothetical protein
MSTIALVPLFKGDAPEPTGQGAPFCRRVNEAVITGVDPHTGNTLQDDDYLKVLEGVYEENRQLVENVARIVAAAMQALLLKDAGHTPQLMMVEGCIHPWGTRPRTGAHTSEAIYQTAVPAETRAYIPSPIIEPHSNRTLAEFQKVYDLRAQLPDDGGVEAVTHPYHQQRSVKIGEEVRRKVAPKVPKTIVHTPNSIAEHLVRKKFLKGQAEGFEHMAIDIFRAAQPKHGVHLSESLHEVSLSVLMYMRQATRGLLDPEATILRFMPGRSSGKMPNTHKRANSLKILD